VIVKHTRPLWRFVFEEREIEAIEACLVLGEVNDAGVLTDEESEIVRRTLAQLRRLRERPTEDLKL